MKLTLSQAQNMVVNPPAPGATASPVTPQIQEETSYIQLDDSPDYVAIAGVSDAEVDAWKQKGKIGFGEDFWRSDKLDLVPVISSEVWRSVSILNAVNRLKENKYDPNDPNAHDQQVQDEQTFVKYARTMAEEQVRGRTIGTDIERGVRAIPAFMGEVVLTGPLATMAKTAAFKAVKMGLVKYTGARAATLAARGAAGLAAGAATMPLAGSHIAGASYTRRRLGGSVEHTPRGVAILRKSNKQPATAAMEALGDSFVQVYSEGLGGAINKTAGRALGAVLPKVMMETMAKIGKRLHPSRAISYWFTRAGYHELYGELGEEVVARIWTALLGLTDDSHAQSGEEYFDNILKAVSWDPTQLLIEAAVLSVPGAGHLSYQAMANEYRKARFAGDIKKMEKEQREAEAKLRRLEDELQKRADAINVDEVLKGEKTDTGEVIGEEEQPSTIGEQYTPASEPTRPTFEDQAKEILGEKANVDSVASRIADPMIAAKLKALDDEAKQLNDTLTTLETLREGLTSATTDVAEAEEKAKRITDKVEALTKTRDEYLQKNEKLKSVEGELARAKKRLAGLKKMADGTTVGTSLSEAQGKVKDLQEQKIAAKEDAAQLADIERDLQAAEDALDLARWRDAIPGRTEGQNKVSAQELENARGEVEGLTMMRDSYLENALRIKDINTELKAAQKEEKAALLRQQAAILRDKAVVTGDKLQKLTERLGHSSVTADQLRGLKQDIQALNEAKGGKKAEIAMARKLKSIVAKLNTRIAKLQERFDVVDNDRGYMLTTNKDQINLDKDKLTVTGKKFADVALAERIRGLKEGLKAGKKITREEVMAAQEDLMRLLDESGVTPAERGKFMNAMKNIQSETQFQNRLDMLQERIGNMIRQRQGKQIKNRIKDMLDSTAPRMEGGKPVGKYTPELQSFFDRLRTVAHMTQEEARAILDARAQSYAVAEDLPDEMAKAENRLLSLMAGYERQNPAGLLELYNDLETFITTGRAENLKKYLDQQEQFKKDIEEGLAEIGAPSKTYRETWLNRQRQKLDRAGNAWVGSWDDILETMSLASKKPRGKAFIENKYHMGRTESAEYASSISYREELVRRAIVAYGAKNELEVMRILYNSEVKPVSMAFTDARGERVTLTMTRAEMRKRIMELRDPSLRPTIVGTDRTTAANGDVIDKGMAWTPEMINWVTYNDLITAGDLAWIDAQVEFYKEYYQRVNASYEEHFGLSLPYSEAYSPILRVRPVDAIQNPLSQTAVDTISFTPSSFKSRTVNSLPLAQQSDWEAINGHIINSEHFIHWAGPLKNLNSFFSSTRIREAIKQQYGEELGRLIYGPHGALNDFKTRGHRISQDWEKTFDGYRRRWITVTLGGRPVQFVKQLTGTFGFAEYVPPVEFMGGMVDFARNWKTIVPLLQKSAVIRARAGDITQEFLGHMRSKIASDFETNPDMKNFIRYYMGFVKAGDQASVMLGGWTVYKYTLDKTGSHEKAMDAMEKAILAVQPSRNLSSLSAWQKGNSFQRLFSTFTSAQARYLAREVSAIKNYAHGRIGHAEFARTMILYHFFIPMLFQWVADGFEWDDEEQLRAAITGPINGLYLWSGLVDQIVRRAIKAAGGDIKVYSEKTPWAPLGQTGSDLIKWVSDQDISYLFKAVVDAGPIFGAPTKQIINDLPNAVSDIRLGGWAIWDGTRKLLGWPISTIDKNN